MLKNRSWGPESHILYALKGTPTEELKFPSQRVLLLLCFKVPKPNVHLNAAIVVCECNLESISR